MSQKLDAVVFDFGGVLVDWNPEYFLKSFFSNSEEIAQFIDDTDYHHWNVKMDLGMPIREACLNLKTTHPHYTHIFDAYEQDWLQTLSGPISGTVSILRDLHESGVPLYGITNYNQDTLRLTRDKYDFFSLFRGIVVSGEEGIMKPAPRIYQILLERYRLKPEGLLFIDDRAENINAAKKLGFKGHVFTSPEDLQACLDQYDF